MLLHGGLTPLYLPTSGGTGHLVFSRGNTLFAVGFDPKRLELVGNPTPILDDLRTEAGASLHATFLLNCFDELRRKVPVRK